MSKDGVRVFIGYDSSESRAYNVCVKSILRRASIPVEIYPIYQPYLRALGLYWRLRESTAATEFSYSRFLTPCLAGYNGMALFIDTDFLFLANIAELFALYDSQYALQCVKHEHHPTETEKMGGIIQTRNPKKNWSSLVLYNCSNPLIREHLTPYNVNTQSGAWLHQFQFTPDELIGELPKEWNSLDDNPVENPKACHLTNGIRALHGNNTFYSDLWEKEENAT